MFWHFTHIWVILPWPHHWGEVWANKTSINRSLFIEVSVSSQDSELSCICVRGIYFAIVSTMFAIRFGTVLTVWYILFSVLLSNLVRVTTLLTKIWRWFHFARKLTSQPKKQYSNYFGTFNGHFTLKARSWWKNLFIFLYKAIILKYFCQLYAFLTHIILSESQSLSFTLLKLTNISFTLLKLIKKNKK